jgi:hypothetical protein
MVCAANLRFFGVRWSCRVGADLLVRFGLIRLLTASGEPYDAYGYTAPQTLALGAKLVVSCNGGSVPLTVNDRGPYVGDRA